MKQISEFLNYVIALMVVVLVGAFYYINKNSEAQAVSQAQKTLQKKTTERSAVEEDKIVNKYLQEASRELMRQKAIADSNLRDAQRRLAELEKAKKLKEQKEIENIPLERQIWKEPARDASAEGLENEISQLQQQIKSLDQEQKRATDEFVENARQEGYYVEVSDDMEVTNATPIRKPSQEDDSIEVYPSD